jgi:hypothetical protein
MGNLTSQLIISLIDKVSGPAKGAAAALKNVAAAEKGLVGSGKGADGLATSLDKASRAAQRLKLSGKNMSGWGDGFQREIDKMNLTSAQLAKLGQEYARFRDGLRGTKASVALSSISDWNKQTLAGLRAVTRAQDEVQRKQSRINTTMRGGARMAAGALGLGGGVYAANRGVRSAVGAGAQLQREGGRSYLAGMSGDEIERQSSVARETSQRFPSIDAAQIMERIRSLRSFTGDFDKGVRLLDEQMQAMTVLQSIKGKDRANQEMQGFMRGMDVLGKNEDPKVVGQLTNAYIKALGVDPDLNMEQFSQFARKSKAAGSALSNEFLGTIVPTFMQDMGGPEMGTALGTEVSQTVAGRGTKKSKAFMQKVGLRDKKGKVVDDNLLLSNPYEWINKYAPDAMRREKMDPASDQDVTKFMSEAFSAQTVANLFGKFITQRSQAERNKKLYSEAPDMETSSKRLREKDPYVAAEGFLAQTRNFASAIIEGPLASAVPVLNRVTDAISAFGRSIAEAEGADKAGKLIAGGTLATGAAAGGLIAAKAAYQWFTGAGALSASAVALNGSAAALTTAAGILSGKGAIPGAGVPPGGAPKVPGGPPKAAAPSLASKVGSGLKTAAPYIAPFAGAAAVPLIILGGGTYAATQAFPDDAESSGKRKSRADTIRAARIENWNADRERQGVPKIGGDDVWKNGAQKIDHAAATLAHPAAMDQSEASAAAGAANGDAYKSALAEKLAAALADINAFVASATSALNFSASPSITPKFGPAPSIGKGAGLDTIGHKYAGGSHSDGNGANFGTT